MAFYEYCIIVKRPDGTVAECKYYEHKAKATQWFPVYKSRYNNWDVKLYKLKMEPKWEDITP